MPTPADFQAISRNLDETIWLGFRLGQLLQGGDVLCLSGDLGVGKTALAVGIGKGWGVLERVNSPTFVFAHEHHRQMDTMCLYHVDCYRLANPEDAATIGLEDMLSERDVVIIEWPERIESMLPEERMWITIEQGMDNTRDFESESMRAFTFTADGARYRALLEAFCQSLV